MSELRKEHRVTWQSTRWIVCQYLPWVEDKKDKDEEEEEELPKGTGGLRLEKASPGECLPKKVIDGERRYFTFRKMARKEHTGN